MVYASRDLFGSLAHAGPFLRRRLARIAPIYWIITVVYLMLSLGNLAPLNHAKPDLWEIIASFLFIPWIKGGSIAIQPAYNLGWSLNYEMFFYGLFALALGLRRNVAVPLLVGVLMILALLGQFIPSSSTQLYFWTRLIILEFGMGMLIAQMALAGLRPTRPFAGLLIVLALIVFALGHMAPDPETYRALYFGPPCALLVIASLAFNDIAVKHPVLRILTGLGDASYAIYLLHPFIMRAVTVLAGAWLVSISPWLYALVCLSILAPVSYAAWLWFERPVTKALQGPTLR